MPAPSFVPCELFEWPGPEATAPKAVAVAAEPPEPERARKAKAKKKRKLRPAKRVIPMQVRTILDNRMEAALNDGRISLSTEDMPCEGLDVCRGELALVMKILLAEEYEEEIVDRLWKRLTKRKG